MSQGIPEFKQRLAKKLTEMVDKIAGEFADLEKREFVREGLLKIDLNKALVAGGGMMGAAHSEPGAHEALAGPPHMEPGQHEQFAMSPPATPDLQDPVGLGTGLPPGHVDHHAGGKCPLCGLADAPGSCTCLNAGMLKNDVMGYGSAGGAAEMAMNEMCKSCGDKHAGACKMVKSLGSPNTKCSVCGSDEDNEDREAVPVVDCEDCGDAVHRSPDCADVGSHGRVICAECAHSCDTCRSKGPTHCPERNKIKMIKGEMPPEKGGKSIPQPGSAGKPKANPLGKMVLPAGKPVQSTVGSSTYQAGPGVPNVGPSPAPAQLPAVAQPSSPDILLNQGQQVDLNGQPITATVGSSTYQAAPGPPKVAPLGKVAVPTAKPPSGKVPGQGAAPVASNTSKPMLGKAALSPEHAQQAAMQANADAHKAHIGSVPGTAAPVPLKPLTNPNDMSRANNIAGAMAGQFQPQGPITSGLDLARPPAPGKVAPGGLKAPPHFLKGETCALCNKTEHPGAC